MLDSLFIFFPTSQFAVVPILVGPLQMLLAALPGMLLAAGVLLAALFKPSTMKLVLRLLWAQRLPVAGLLCVGALLWWGMPKLRPARVAAAGGAASEIFRRDPARRAWLGNAADPTAGGRRWSYRGDGPTYLSSPAVVGGYVYAASAEISPFAPLGTGRIVCLDAETGAPVWRDGAGDLRAVFSSPAVTADYVVCGEGLHTATDARVVCLRRSTGKRLWEFRTRQHVESSPCIYEGKVYVGAGDDGYYCLALEGAGTPRVIWHRTAAEGFMDCESDPVASEGKIYVGLGEGGNAICCLAADTGELLWKLPTPFPVFAPPSLADGKLYVGMGNGDFANTAEQLGKPGGGQLWCIDLKRPQAPLWVREVGQTILGAAAVADGRVYVGSMDGRLRCLGAADGRVLAEWNARSPILTCPAVAGSHVYVVTQNGMLYGLDSRTLAPVWEACLWTKPPDPGEDHFLSSPVVANGHVYVGTAKDGLLCVGEPGCPPERVWAGFLGGPGLSGRLDISPVAEVCEAVWCYPERDGEQDFQPTAPPAGLDHRLYLPVTARSGPALVQLRLDEKDPKKPPTLGWSVSAAKPVLQSAILAEDAVFFVEGGAGEGGCRLRALSAGDGREQWSAPVAADAPRGLVCAGGTLLTALRARGLDCLGLDGKPRWTYDGGRVVGMPAMADGRVVVAMADPPRLAILDAPTGRELLVRDLPAAPVTGPVLAGGAAYVGLDTGVVAYTQLDGRELWRREGIGRANAPLVLAGGWLGQVNADGTLNLVAATDGRIGRSIADVSPDFPPMLAADGVFFGSRNGLLRSGFDSASVRAPWLRLVPSRTGRQRTPPIVLDGFVYLGTSKGLVCAGPRE